MKKKRVLPLTEILILIIGIIAISYSIGSEIGFVEADSLEPIGVGAVSTTPDPTGKTSFETAEEWLEWRKSQVGEETTIVSGPQTTGPVLSEIPEKVPKDKGKLFAAQEGFWKGLWSATKWGLVAYFGTKMLGDAIGMEEEKVDALSAAAGIGAFAGRGAYLIWGEGLWGMSPTTTGIFTGVAVGAVVFVMMYEEESTQTVTLICEPWQAPTGGENCEECNDELLPCSEYQCKSLGQSCELLNAGTENEKCVWVNRNDVEFPIIEPWEDALSVDYNYQPDNAILPPDKGVEIIRTQTSDGCVEAFTPLSFGITLNEPGQCKLDYQRKESFDEMDYYFGSSTLFKYNHSQTMSLPGTEALGEANLTLYNDGDYGIYVRCQDANGNQNTGNFVFKFCVQEGPDTTPPLIIITSILDGKPIAYNQTKLENLILYISEPADCRWSKTDYDYENMENQMSCSSSMTEMNAQMVYECETTLTGLKNNRENEFYFRCKDKPGAAEEDRNVNTESYPFTLIGTRPLYINSLEPNETIKDSTDVIKVTLEAETSAGYNEGEATCYYSESCYKEDGGYEESDYTAFYYEEGSSSYSHSQELYLTEGSYECYVKCVDLGGNSDTEKTEYTVETDTAAPIVVRIYSEETYLKLITNEEGECVYDTASCEYLFEDGISMSEIDGEKHFTDWNPDINYYIKCQDEYENRPMPNECSIIARPFEIEFE